MAIYLEQHTEILASDIATPISIFMDKVASKTGILLESAEIDGKWGRYSLIASDFLLTLSCNDSKLVVNYADEIFKDMETYHDSDFLTGLEKILSEIYITQLEADSLPAITRALYGYVGYNICDSNTNTIKNKLPTSVLVLPKTLYVFDHAYHNLFKLTLKVKNNPKDLAILKDATPRKIPSPKELLGKVNYDQEKYLANLQLVANCLKESDVLQVFLATKFQYPNSIELFDFYRKLRRYYPAAYMSFMRFNNFSLAVSSKAALVTCSNNRLKLCPLADNKAYSSVKALDNIVEDDFSGSNREFSEHIMLLDVGFNDLAKISEQDSVKIDKFMEIENQSSSLSFTSAVTSTLQSGKSAVDIIRAIFPAAGICGFPKQKALEKIGNIEDFSREIYCSAIGWLGLDKSQVNLDLGITLRAAWQDQDNLNWCTGTSLLKNFNPAIEWQECIKKSQELESILQAVQKENYVTYHK